MNEHPIIINDLELIAALAWQQYKRRGLGAIIINRTAEVQVGSVEIGMRDYDTVVYYVSKADPFYYALAPQIDLDYNPAETVIVIVLEKYDGNFIYKCTKFRLNTEQCYERRRMELGDVPKYRLN